MKVLFITNMYPVEDYIYFGIHVKEQIEAIEKVAPNFEKEVYFINGRASKQNYFKSITGIKNVVEKGNFDLIHVHYGLSALFMLFYKPAIPVVVTLHSGELYQKKGYINHFLQKNITLLAIKNAKKIIVLNDDMVSLLSNHQSKLFKLPCGTDTEYFKEQPVSKNLQKITIGFPGNKARKEKNFALFSDIINKLKSDFNIEVIEFHNLKRDDVVMNLNKIDLLLMTSTVEGSPQIIKEAMACNKPIVSTAVGDVADLLQGVENSYVVNSFNAQDFITPINSIVKLSPENRKSPGKQKLVEMGLDAETVAKSIYKMYQELV